MEAAPDHITRPWQKKQQLPVSCWGGGERKFLEMMFLRMIYYAQSPNGKRVWYDDIICIHSC